MQTIIIREKLQITGLTGNGSKTLEVWTDFDSRFTTNPFTKADETGYEIRFWQNRKTRKAPDQNKSVHVGFLSENLSDNNSFTTIEFPAAEYAVFDVYVDKGYDSENDKMEKWLEDNKFIFGLREFDGYEYIIECYNEKFKDGNKPDSIVEMWMPLFRFCQSCYMPMTKSKDFGTEIDGCKSNNYCCHCYQEGDFTTKQTLEEAIEGNIMFWRDGCKNDDEARTRILKIFPKLKRWLK